MNGIINLLKPPCLSSAQAVSFIKRLTKEKTGHAGTLDPEACGVLPVMVGKATRLFDYITERQKVYVAEIAFGMSTDTQDATGKVIDRGTRYPSQKELEEILPLYTGSVMQCPPSYSAIKLEGRPLYVLAREGKLMKTQAREIEINQIELLNETRNHGYIMRIHCGKGTYIRTLCHDIGIKLACPAHMRMLIREKTGPFCIEQSITLEEFTETHKQNQPMGTWFMSMQDTIAYMPAYEAPANLWKRCINGVSIPIEAIEGLGVNLEEGSIAAIHCCNELIGVYQKNSDHLKVRTMLYT